MVFLATCRNQAKLKKVLTSSPHASPLYAIPALFTKMSSPPYFSLCCWNSYSSQLTFTNWAAFSILSPFVRSSCKNFTLSSWSESTASRPKDSFLAVNSTVMPSSFANCFTISLPIPLLAPVTKAIFSVYCVNWTNVHPPLIVSSKMYPFFCVRFWQCADDHFLGKKIQCIREWTLKDPPLTWVSVMFNRVFSPA